MICCGIDRRNRASGSNPCQLSHTTATTMEISHILRGLQPGNGLCLVFKCVKSRWCNCLMILQAYLPPKHAPPTHQLSGRKTFTKRCETLWHEVQNSGTELLTCGGFSGAGWFWVRFRQNPPSPSVWVSRSRELNWEG